MTVYTKSMMESLAEVRGLQEDNLDEATGNEIKKYMKAKWGVVVKASKVGSGKYMRVGGEIPNKFREKVIKKFMPDAKIRDMKNIDYGNVKNNYVALRTTQWDELINEEVELGEVAGTFTIVANGISDLKKADKQYLKDTQYSIAAGLAEDGVELDEEGVSYKGNSIIIPSDNEDMRMVQSWTKNQTKLAADTVKIIKPNMDYNDLYEERADHLYVAALLTKTAKPNRAPKYSVKFVKEETELDEGGVPGTEKTVTVIHKTSGKELEVTANSVKKYEKMGYKVVKETTEIGERVAEQLARIKGNIPVKEGRMKELHGYIAQGKSAEWIAKKMGVDAKTIKALMAGYKEAYEVGTDEYREYLEKLTPGEVDEASARADAMRAMGRGKKVDPADVDTDASDADVKAASKNILAQMRKSVSLGGRFDVEFLDKKKVRVKPAIANAFVKKYEGMRKPADKEKFQNQAMKSYKDLLRVLKAGYYEELELDEWTISDVEIAMKKKYGKVDKEAIEKLKKVLYKGNVDRNDLVKVGHGKLHVESVELDEALPSHLKKHFDKDGNPKTKEGKAAWERIKKIKMKGYTPKQVKMAIGIAFDKRFVQGNMTGAAKTIEKIAKGLSDFEPVANALRRANEETILDRIDRKLKERKNG